MWDSDSIIVSPKEAIRERYSRGAREVEPALCCPVTYDPKYLRVIPAEILERNHGCGYSNVDFDCGLIQDLRRVALVVVGQIVVVDLRREESPRKVEQLPKKGEKSQEK